MMKLVSLLAAWLLCTGLAQADAVDRERLSADWWLLGATTDGATEQERTANAIEQGVDAQVAARLTVYVGLGNQQLRDFAHTEAKHLCDNQKIYAADRQALAAALDRTETLEEAILKYLFDRMDADLRAGAMTLIEHARPHATLVPEGRRSGDVIRSGTEDLKVFLAGVCARS